MLDFLELLSGNTLTRLVFFPALAAIPLLWARSDRGLRWYLLLISAIELCFAFFLLRGRFDASGALQPLRDVGADGAVLDWIPSLGVSFDLGLDGISLPLIALALLLLPISILGSWSQSDLRWSTLGITILLSTATVLGTLLSLDLFVFFVFWEALLIPILFSAGLRGTRRASRSAMRFILMAVFCDLLMLLAILQLALHHVRTKGSWSFSYLDCLRLDLSSEQELWLFSAFALAFAVRVALFPLHGWLPDTYVESPVAGSLLMGGLVLSSGAYGFLRFALPLFPAASFRAQPLVITLSVIGILLGASSAWIQTDLRKVLAYGSVSQLSLVMLGIFTFDLVAWEGVSLHLFHHGIAIATLLLLAGMLHDRGSTWKLDEMAGLVREMPLLAFSVGIACFALAGVPLLSGFAGEITILAGTFRSLANQALWIPVAATAGLLATTLYLLRIASTVLSGPSDEKSHRGLADLVPREILTVAPLLILMIILGLAPQLLLQKSRAALARSHQQMHERLPDQMTPSALSSPGSRPGTHE